MKRHSKRGKIDGKGKGERLSSACLSMYSITENIYYSQLPSVAILLQPEPNCFTSYNTSKSLCSLSICAIVLRSFSHVSTSNGQRSSQLFFVHYRYIHFGEICFRSEDRDSMFLRNVFNAYESTRR
jgi:hypothetical protein